MFKRLVEFDQVDRVGFLGSLLLVVKHGLPVLELKPSELETLSNELITWNTLNCRQN